MSFIHTLFVTGSSFPVSLTSEIVPQQVIKASSNGTVAYFYHLISIIVTLVFCDFNVLSYFMPSFNVSLSTSVHMCD